MNYVTPKDREEINEIVHDLKKSITFSWAIAARRTGWSATTVRKYYDENWYPGKYFQKPVPAAKIKYNCKPGLYLLAQQIVEDNQIIKLIKIGKSKCLYQRLNSYKGMNPFAKCIDIYNCSPEELDDLEKSYHIRLSAKNRRYANTEWFICTDEEFDYWSNYKFKKVA